MTFVCVTTNQCLLLLRHGHLVHKQLAGSNFYRQWGKGQSDTHNELMWHVR